MTLAEQIEKDFVSALKSQETLRVSVLRMVKSSLKLKQVETGQPLTDEQVLAILRMLVKQRHEAAEMFQQGGRNDLADKELAEIVLLEGYLPAVATDEEMDSAVAAAIAETGATSPKEMGKVMKAATVRLAGKTVDGKRLSEKVRAKLPA
ncbi:MAG TPA: GatB/YqeY domain-containing protein [Terriglobia bacterium]|nr:GatB/YqeY domain-containing protein [Terriglobia bacterium]